MTARPDEEEAGPTTVTTRTRLVEAAGRAFRQHGYARCSTRQIADEAGVGETLLFRHFGSKAQLFDIAIRAQFDEAVVAFTDRWSDQSTREASGTAARAQRFMQALCMFVSEQREVILALMTFNAFEDSAPACGPTVRRALTSLQSLVQTHVLAEPDDVTAVRPRAAAVMALVLGTLVLDDSVWSEAERPSVEVTAAEVTAMALWGVSRRSPRRHSAQRGRGLPQH